MSESIVRLYSVYDKKAEAFNPPFISVNDEAAKLAIRQALVTQNDAYIKSALKDDALELLCVAAFDMKRGNFKAEDRAIIGVAALFSFDELTKPIIKEEDENATDESCAASPDGV